MSMDEYQTWYEIWTDKNPYFFEDDNSPYRYKDLEEVEKALRSVDEYPSLSQGRDLNVMKVIQVMVRVSI